ncbi:hypothetical protein Trco_006006 [Trichoderma cornu-damae]|uniref:Uncharacterized protein n=1 Tax=Trichoderma cornu-damae TaxID=654480 RepID=A0A9P8QQF2_9HYPO|nr:hypothetical protein Trco_006006 [Trichoderma cornu-damae]
MSGVTPSEDGEAIKTFSAAKAWLTNHAIAPGTPYFLQNEIVDGDVAATPEHPSSDRTKEFSDASVRKVGDPPRPSATGISETSRHDQGEDGSAGRARKRIMASINQILSPESKTMAIMPAKSKVPPAGSLPIKERLAGFGGGSRRSKSSWNISEGLSDNGNQDQHKQPATPHKEVSISRTMTWLLKVSKPPAPVPLLAPDGGPVDHYKKDIDTVTGSFLPEIQYPDTFKSLRDGPSGDQGDIAWRQANMTAELQITREIRSRELLATKLRSQLKPRVEAAPVEQTTWPKAECIVRPAVPEDFEAIATIMNMERQAKRSPQVLEWQEVVAADIQKIYDGCRDGLRPFVVATTANDALLDRSNWPEHATTAYQSYLSFRSSQAQLPREVYGFAFVAEARVGILGTACPGSRHSGHVKVIVHPDHRGKLYGSALLDRILLCIAPFHRTLVDYEWQCQDPAGMYEAISYQNRRKYAWIYVETICAGRDDRALKLAANYLQKFEFKEACYLPSAVKTDRYYDSQWLDLVLWARETQPRSNITDLAPGAQGA